MFGCDLVCVGVPECVRVYVGVFGCDWVWLGLLGVRLGVIGCVRV